MEEKKYKYYEFDSFGEKLYCYIEYEIDENNNIHYIGNFKEISTGMECKLYDHYVFENGHDAYWFVLNFVGTKCFFMVGEHYGRNNPHSKDGYFDAEYKYRELKPFEFYEKTKDILTNINEYATNLKKLIKEKSDSYIKVRNEYNKKEKTKEEIERERNNKAELILRKYIK